MNPITNVPAIEHRLDVVEAFSTNPDIRTEVITLLKRTCDANRLIQRFTMARGAADDMVSIARTIEITEKLRVLLSAPENPPALQKLVENIIVPTKLAKSIRKAIDEDGVMQQQRAVEEETQALADLAAAATKDASPRKPLKTLRILKEEHKEKFEAWVMLPSASPTLKKLHAKLEELFKDQQILEHTLQEEFSASSLSLKWTPALAHNVHVKSIHSSEIKEKHYPITSTRSTSAFHLPSWTTLGAAQDTTRLAIRAAESALYSLLRASLIKTLPTIRPLSHLLASLDVLTTFSHLSQTHNLIRPVFITQPATTLTSAIHLPVAHALSKLSLPFTSNSLIIPPKGNRLHILTGPNMSGKSTYLRLIAHAHLLAQTGSYIPAAFASLGPVDAIYAHP